jgi:acetyl esterase/lipase
VVERTIPGPAGDIPVRVIVPERPVGVYQYMHGGGWTLFRAHHTDLYCERIARKCDVVTVSVDYRLAPEHPYPAGPDDCEAAALWLAGHAQAEWGTDRLVLGGDSAGAHLAAVALLRLRDRHGYTEAAGANFLFASYDLTMTPSARNWGERRLVVNTPGFAWFIDQFVPSDIRRDEPDVSPLYADLRALPPALFSTGTLDPILDDSLFMYARWVAAGNRAELAVYPGGVHGCHMHRSPVGREANLRAEAFIRDVVGQTERAVAVS